MEDIIHLLPDSVANQIAAGEVVQRPASIVKEMVENSIDAQATNVQVLIVGGGKTCVQVIDNGIGMSETDARMAFERHATSKISKAADLFTLTTMGFRGEALASIAAVAHVDLKTKRQEDQLGVHLLIQGSKVVEQEPVACPVGSNFAVNNLFYNVPARRKFLKSDQTELTNVITEFERIALVHPDVGFQLSSNGNEVYHLPATILRQRIIDIFGKKINAELLPIEVETSIVSISGYVGKPESARKKGPKQFFFVNGRFMKHPYFHVAVMKAYEQLIPPGEHVSYFVYLSVDPSTIDVNVHPTKTEIKFDNEQEIWQVLSAAVREALGKFSAAPTIDFDVEGRPDIPAFIPADAKTKTTPVMPATSSSYNPFNTGGAPAYQRKNTEWEKLYGTNNINQRQESTKTQTVFSQDDTIGSDLFADNTGSTDSRADNQNQTATWQYNTDLPHFQYNGKYLVFPAPNGVVMVNQHRAHVRVLYERFLKRIKSRKMASQGLLFPEVVQFTKAEKAVIDEIIEDLAFIGFELTDLGGGAFSVGGVPSEIQGLNPVDLLHKLISSAMEETGGVIEEMKESVALAMAKCSAVAYGQVLTEQEINELLTALFKSSSPQFTPDGKSIFALLDDLAINKLF